MLADKKGRQIQKYVPYYVVFDFETTGTSTTSDDIIEISAVKVDSGTVADEFSTLVNPKRSIPMAASLVNGITNSMVAEAPIMAEVLPDFLDFIGDYPLVGHNIKNFDMKLLYREVENYYKQTLDNDFSDTLGLARLLLPQLDHHRLTDLAAYYGISTDGAHRALNDCRMNQQVYEKLCREREKQEKSGKSLGKICPKCGSMMKKRTGRYGEFWGCTGYPNCRYTENI